MQNHYDDSFKTVSVLGLNGGHDPGLYKSIFFLSYITSSVLLTSLKNNWH